MIKRTLYFENACHLSIKNQNLLVTYKDTGLVKKANVEDIGIVILDSYSLSLTQSVLNQLLQNNVALLVCDQKHMPKGLFLNLNGHYTQQAHWHTQVAVSQAKKDRIWKRIVQQKIRNQAYLLKEQNLECANLMYWANEVSNGDPENKEGQAASYYWKNIFQMELDFFKRGQYEEPPNHLLNYGYAILRAVVARSLVASGLLPSFGIHHRNSYNAYCLADDVMEPYRPFVDRLVLEMVCQGLEDIELTTDVKKHLLQIPTLDVYINGMQSPLMVAVQQTTASLYKCFNNANVDVLKLPFFG